MPGGGPGGPGGAPGLGVNPPAPALGVWNPSVLGAPSVLPPKLLIGVPAEGVGPPKPEGPAKCLGVWEEGLRTDIDCMEDIAEMVDMWPGVRAGVRPGVMRPAP